MRKKPILFNTEMVRAILDDRKTSTRRVINPELVKLLLTSQVRKDNPQLDDGQMINRYMSPPFRPGDVLYIRETWALIDGEYLYRADSTGGIVVQDRNGVWKDPSWRPSIHMPKDAARIFLQVKAVHAEQLRDITEEGAVREGLYKGWRLNGRGSLALSARQAFMWLWETITRRSPAAHSWALNPWVWVIEFERCEDPGKIKQPTLRDQGGPVIQKDHEDNMHCTKHSAGCQGGDEQWV